MNDMTTTDMAVRRMARDDAREAVKYGATAPWGDGETLSADRAAQISDTLGSPMTREQMASYDRSFRLAIECYAPFAK